ncbi:MAG: PAS domain-containing protein [Desulfuromonadales bacterium]
MKRPTFSHTVRGRLLLLALGIEVIMLTLMVANNLRLLHIAMTGQAQKQAAQMAPVLIAALRAPVAQRDYATIQAVLDESRETEDIDYIVVTDKSGKQMASSGWSKGAVLPPPSTSFSLFGGEQKPRYNVAVAMSQSQQKLGTLHFGLDLTDIVTARTTLLTQGIKIALLELFLSSIILLLFGIWLTRHLKHLANASLEVAAGNLSLPPVPEGNDDIGQLGKAFNTMSRTIAERINELTAAKESAEISERAKTESEERLKLVLDGSNDGFWDWDIQSGRIDINRRWAAMVGYAQEEIVHHIQSWVDMVHPDDLPGVQKVLNAHLAGITPLYETEHRVRAKNGTWVWVLDRGKVVLRDADGTPLRAAGTHTDITARKCAEEQIHEQAVLLECEMAERQRAQEELAVKQLQLEAVNSSLKQRIDDAISELRQKDQVMISQSRQAAMGEMIGNIAHQWRQPLNALAMTLGNITAAYQYDELTAEYLDKTVENGNRLIQKMSSTINDFRNFFIPDKEAVSFSAREQILHAVALVEAGLTSQNIAVHLEAPQDLMLTGFPNEYSQVLLNLFANSRDAIRESGTTAGSITIRLYKRDERGCVAVSDTGGGIPADVLEKMFEPYFSTKEMGTGIGLYMSKMIIERSMNGHIEVHNIEDGAEFIIITPLEDTLS